MAWREQISANLLKVNNENTRTMCKIYSKLEKKKSYRTKLRKRHSRVFIANFVWTDFTYCSEFSIVDFELVNATLKT